jgi:hypothetical protein
MCGAVHPFLRKIWFLQSYTNSENVLVGPHRETYPALHEANQALDIKVKECSDAEEEEDPVPITFPKIEAEPEVSSVCTVMQIT